MSPRPRKPRHCACPHQPREGWVFKPAGVPLKNLEKIHLDHDEFDALHLCDGEGLTQAEAGARLGVSRGTVQRLVAGGRKKLMDALVEGRALIIAADADET